MYNNSSAAKNEYEKEVQSPLTDSLTGLFNHGYFKVALDHEVKRYNRHRSPFSLCLIDIDWFSHFNKRFGSIEGDRMLKDIGNIIASAIRDVDIAARYLGDIFAVVYTMSEREDAGIAGERLCRTIEEKTEGKITASLGLASCYKGMTSASLILKAQQALAEAKTRGKNRVHLYEEQEFAAQELSSKILVVDDEAVNRKLLEMLLLTLGYQVLMASDGEEALHIVSKTDIDSDSPGRHDARHGWLRSLPQIESP